jgi:hypothetical protein
MSLNLNPLKVVQVIDPVTKLNSSRSYAILKGGEYVAYQSVSSNAPSPASVVWSANPPSPQIIVDRRLYIFGRIQLTFTGTSASGPLLQIGTNDAPRAFPLQQIINTLAATLNNATVTLNENEVFNTLIRINTSRDVRERDYSSTPHMLDQYQNYSDWSVYGAVKNPLGLYGDNGYESPRGGFSSMTVVSNPSGGGTLTSVVTLDLCEPLFMSPFLFGGEDEAGFIGIQTMQISLTLNQLTRMWAHSSLGNPLSSVTGAWLANPSLLFRYITPSKIVALPESSVYPFFVPNYYITDFGTIAPAGTATIVTQNIQFQGVPNQIILYARQSDTTLNTGSQQWLASDTFARINNANLNWNGTVGLLSSATPRQLYQISRKNGVDMSWDAWSFYVGSILSIDLATDVGLGPTIAPGMNGTFNFQATLMIQNVNTTQTINYSVFVLAINEGTFTSQGNQCFTNQSILTPADVLDSQSAPIVDLASVKAVMRGGSIFSSFQSFIDKYLPIAKKAVAVGRQAYDLGKPVYEEFQRSRGRGRGRGLDFGRYDEDEDEPQYVSRSGLYAM